MSNPNTAVVLDQAADVIERYGWVQDTMGNAETGYCAIGALSAATNILWGRPNAGPFEALMGPASDALLAEIGGADTIPAWNDAEGRTKEEVVDHLRWTAKRLRAGG